MNAPDVLPPTITVTGHGRASVTPDRIVFTITVSSLAPTVDESRRKLEDLRAGVSAALNRAGVPADAIRSAGPDWRPEHEYEKQVLRFKGIRGDERLRVETPREPGRTPTILRELGAQLQLARVDVSHAASDTSAALAKALAAAVADARTRAEAIASAAGVRLGPVRSLTHGNEDQRSRGGYAGAICEEAIPVEIEANDVVVNAEIAATWELLPAA
jgi:uncharacterized protein YggE